MGGVAGSSPDSAPGGNGGNGGNGGGTGRGKGGAIVAYYGPITISNSVFHENGITLGGQTGDGGAGGAGGNGGQGLSGTPGGTGGTGGIGGNPGYYLLSGYGGGIYAEVGSSGSVNITNTTISGNTSGDTNDGSAGGAGGPGGAGGASSTPTANGGPGGAGGYGGTAQRGCPGGGITLFNSSGSITNLVFTTVVYNFTPSGTGIGGTGGSGGSGGLGSTGTPAASGETGHNGGDAYFSSGAGLYQTDGTVNLKNSLVAANITDEVPDCVGTFVSQDYNLIGVTGDYCTITYAGHDLHDGTASPLNLESLANNYGKTKTHAILPGSVALNFIPYGTNGCGTTYTTDQRGFYRPLNAACEIGAFEYGHLFQFMPLIQKLAGIFV